jgi:paraquat-inducible protein B
MSVKANPAKVGAFVLAGIALSVVALVVFGSGRLFRHNVPFILHYENSVQGLTVGAPVKFRGVVVGRVRSIHLALDPRSHRTQVPVVIELDNDLIRDASGQDVDLEDKKFLQAQVAGGLRGSLEMESLITGRLYVQLDYHPKAGPPVFVDLELQYPEIPTISTGLAEFLKSLERVDIPHLTEKLTTVVEQLSATLNESQLKQLSEQAIRTLKSADELLASPEIKTILISLRQTSDEARSLVSELRAEIKPMAGSITNTAERASVALADLQQTLQQARQLIGRDSPLLAELDQTLAEFADAARAVRLLSEQLRRNPNSLIFGAKPREMEPSK